MSHLTGSGKNRQHNVAGRENVVPFDPTLPLLPSQQVTMLKTKNLNKLLSQNTSSHVTSAIIFTPSGSLIASSHSPSSPKTLRTQTTLAANIWCAYAATPLPLPPPPPPSPLSSSLDDDHHNHNHNLNHHHQPKHPQTPTSLTLELSTSNLHITQIRPRLLLCLIGPATPNIIPPSQPSPPSPPPPPTPLPQHQQQQQQQQQQQSQQSQQQQQSQQSQQQPQPPPGKPPSSSSSTSPGNRSPQTTNNNATTITTITTTTYDTASPPTETPDPATHATSNNNDALAESSPSRGSSVVMDPDVLAQQSGALGILRTQGEGLARWLEGELEGFSMPETM